MTRGPYEVRVTPPAVKAARKSTTSPKLVPHMAQEAADVLRGLAASLDQGVLVS